MNRKHIIYGSLAVAGAGVIFIVLNRMNKQAEINLLIETIKKGTGAEGEGREALKPNQSGLVPLSSNRKQVIDEIARDINDSWGLFNDDEEKIYGALRRLSNKNEAGWLSKYYYAVYKQDLYQTLKSKLSSSEFSVVESILKQL